MTDRTIDSLLAALGRSSSSARSSGGADVAEAIARSGSELSTKVRLGEPELVEEAGHRGLGMRVMKGKQVALTSTRDLTDARHRSLRRGRARARRALAGRSVRRPGRSGAHRRRPRSPDLDLFDPEGRRASTRRRRSSIAKLGEQRRARLRSAHHQQRRRDASAAPRAPSRSCSRAASAAAYTRLVRVAQRRARRRGRRRQEAPRLSLDREALPRRARRPEEVGEEAARRTLRKLGAQDGRDVRGAGRLRSRRRALDPRHARRLRHGQRDLAQIELPRSAARAPRSRARSSPSSTIRSSRARPARARSTAKGLAAPQERRRREGRPQDVPLRQLHRRASSVARSHRQRGARRRRRRRRSHDELHPRSPAPTRTPSIVEGHEARPLRHRDDGLRLQRRHRRLLARRGAASGSRTASSRYPVSEVTISLNVDELWKRIDAVGSDLDLRTATASPTIRVSAMTVAGT